MVRVFLILGKQQSTSLSPINDFGRKNLQSSQAQAILSDIFKIPSDIFKIPSDVFKIPSDEKEISWDGIFKNSHKIARTSHRFFPFKQKQAPKEPISHEFIEKTAIFKGAENRVFPSSLLVARIFVLNGGGKSRKVSLNLDARTELCRKFLFTLHCSTKGLKCRVNGIIPNQSYKVKVFATVK